jgi:hypothetical protein
LRFWLKSRRPGQLVIVPDPIVADTATFFRYDQANDFNTPEIHVNLPQDHFLRIPGSLILAIRGQQGSIQPVISLTSPMYRLT